MAQTKATKKFEQRHLKDTLERRKGLKKVKQKQQLKARQKSRRDEENGRDGQAPKEQEPARGRKKQDVDSAFQSMSMDDFFQGGFEVPELPSKKAAKPGAAKRKRVEEEEESEVDDEDDSASEMSFSNEPAPAAADGESDSDSEADPEDFKKQLDALATKDPEFHQLLQQDEPEVFEDMDGLELSEDDDDQPKRKKQKKDADDSDDDMGGTRDNELDMATVKKWRAALEEKRSLGAAKEVVVAFRTAAQVSISEEDGKRYKYSVSDSEVYHELLITALTQMPAVFEHHLPVQASKGGKVHVATDTKKFKNLVPLLRAQIAGILHLLDHLSDASTLKLTLSSLTPLLPYLLSFKKLIRDVAKAVSEVWSSSANSESTRIAAFLVMRRLVEIGDLSIRENSLKAVYQALVRSSRNTTIHTMGGVNLMKNSAADLWGLASGEGGVAYTTAFTFIRSLAMHLRTCITNNKSDSYKEIYNWQYVHSLDFWSRVLAAHCVDPASSLRPLIYPLVQVTLGALRLIPTATYFPLRFQLIRALLRVSMATSTYIPLAAPLYEVLASAEMRKPPKPSTSKPLDFSTSIRAPKAYLRTRVYQDGVGEQVQELLAEFFVLWAKNIAFPELAVAPVVMLKRWLKEVNSRGTSGNKNMKINNAIHLLVQKIEANSRWIEERRAKVEFAPNNRKGVQGFLEDVSWEKTPLGAFVVGQRKTREQKMKIVEQGRKEEERRRLKENNAKAAEAEEEEEEEEEESDDEMDGDEDVLAEEDDSDDDEE